MRSYKEITDIGKYPDLQSALDDVEFALEQRPNLAVQSMRVAVEIMLKNLCRQHFGQEGEDNSTRLKMLKEGNIVSGTLNDRLHQLRSDRVEGHDVLGSRRSDRCCGMMR